MMIQINKNGYVPKPKLLVIQQLPDFLHHLVEGLGENVHETWAYQKMKEGWVFGETFDQKSKKHPSLKPYAELDESQKNYDKKTALATISFLINEGYIISK